MKQLSSMPRGTGDFATIDGRAKALGLALAPFGAVALGAIALVRWTPTASALAARLDGGSADLGVLLASRWSVALAAALSGALCAFVLGGALAWAAHVLLVLRGTRSLVWDFVRRDMKARYAGASLSFFWSVVAPLINLVVFMFVFQLIMGARWGDRMTPHEVTLLMLTGIVVWTAFSETLFRSTMTMVDNTNLIQKVVFPSEVLPTFLSISSLINMCFGIPIVLAGMTWIGSFSQTYLGEREAAIEAGKEVGAALGWGPGLLVLPVLFALQLVFATGLGFMLATLNVLLRDVQHLIGIVLMVWMFTTPIFYPAELVAMKGYGVMLEVNPMYWLIDSYRAALLYGAWPDWALVGRFAVAALVTFALGSRMLVLHKPRFPDLL